MASTGESSRSSAAACELARAMCPVNVRRSRARISGRLVANGPPVFPLESSEPFETSSAHGLPSMRSKISASECGFQQSLTNMEGVHPKVNRPKANRRLALIVWLKLMRILVPVKVQFQRVIGSQPIGCAELLV